MKMFQDISLSKALNEEYRKFVKNLDAADGVGGKTRTYYLKHFPMNYTAFKSYYSSGFQYKGTDNRELAIQNE